VVPARYFGHDLAMFRTADGSIRVVDAHCPHLGAHFGHGGKVVDGCVVCPFHAWKFDGTGRCVEVPYARKIPGKARVRVWPSVEADGMVWVWHHKDGTDPAWEVAPIAEREAGGWTEWERFDWTIRSQNQELAENAVDRAHFRYVHGTATVPDTEVTIDGHVRRAVSRATMSTPRGDVEGVIDTTAHGMGRAIVRFSGICDTLLVSATTPIDRQRVHTRFSFSQRAADADGPRGNVAHAIVRDIVKQIGEDIPIWENKRYADKPLLCDGDGPIAQFRRWASRFY
jgi:phenylpropionate dioxygenase-like ring-hydroxylating dioxygenase large terminal subunit